MASKPMSSLLAAGAAAVGLALWLRRKAQENAARRAALARRGAEAYGLSSQKLSEMAEDFDRRYIRSGRLRGAVVAVMRGGEVVAVWELGSFTKQTVFKLYSITKVFTAIAGLQVCEEHKISLDTPISTLVPEWPDKLNLEDEKGRLVPVEEPLLLRHCFTHTGGFSDTMRGAHPTCLWRPVERRRWAAAASQKPADLREMMAWEGQEPLLCRPGQHFNYLGVGVNLVARFVEEKSKKSLAEYMAQSVLQPAGMEHSGFILDEALAGECVPVDCSLAGIPTLASIQPTAWAALKLRCRGLLATLRGAFRVELIPAGAGVIEPLKLWDKSLKVFHADAGLVATGKDVIRWLQLFTGKAKAYSSFVLTALATPVTPELEAPFALDAPKSTRLFPVHGDSVPRRCRPFNCHPGQRYSLGACVIAEPAKSGLPDRAAGSWHWMGFGSTYFFVNPKEELAACFLSQCVSHQSYPILDELVGAVHSALI